MWHRHSGSLRAQGSCRGEQSAKAGAGPPLVAAEEGERATAYRIVFGVQNMKSMTSSMVLVRVLRAHAARDVQGAEGGP